MWKESSIKVNGEVFHYWIKQYDKGSEWGIDGGRISKLSLIHIYGYGWPGPRQRWCTTRLKAMPRERFLRELRKMCIRDSPRAAATPLRHSRCL